ncbi:SAM-dependent methyltransferase [Murinocardiopsis flavida]|uniref:SAM-dependent methyltransferase n=1 Tax=Murinocardiopsis flavida TaxID=645275 RepID=UPI000D0D0D45|nr:SAM-dependent methyltransferase [Murinocardiopsis flavida]
MSPAPDPGFPSIDVTTPTTARIYDWMLHGKDNFEADQRAGRAFLDVAPQLRPIAHYNRAWLARVVAYMTAELGLDQFLDIGSGLPTVQNTHQVAQGINPKARVVYVDNDPVVLTHGRALLADNDRTTVATADISDPDAIINGPDTQRMLDFSRPVGVLLIALVHCIPDEPDPGGLIGRILDAVPSGSAIAYSHIVSTEPRAADDLTRIVLEATHGHWGRVRTPAEALAYIDRPDLEAVAPGFVDIRTWHPAPDAEAATDDPIWEIGGLARKL